MALTTTGSPVPPSLSCREFDESLTVPWTNPRPETPIHDFEGGTPEGFLGTGRVLTPSPLVSAEHRHALGDTLFRSINALTELAIPELLHDVAPEPPVQSYASTSALDHGIPAATVASAMACTLVPSPDHVITKTKKTETKRKASKPSIFDGLPPFWVLLGRNPRCYRHPGSDRLLHVHRPAFQPQYLQARKNEKSAIAQEMVDTILAEGGRFMKYDKAAKVWIEVPNKTAREKAAQALREQMTPEKRQEKRKRYPKKRKGGPKE